jgi:ABC-type glycerol-3-phosphate transport system substrate-binding protein
MNRRKFIYAGLGAIIVVLGGLTAYFATRPPEVIEKPVEKIVTTTVEKPVEKTVVTTVAGTPTTIVRTEKVVETIEKTVEVTPTKPKVEMPWEKIEWDSPDWVDRLTGVEIGPIPDHWIERWPFLKTYRKERIAAIKGFQLPKGWKKAVEGVKQIKFLNYGGMAHDPATAMGMSAFEDMTGIRVVREDMEELTLWLKTISIMTAKSDAIAVQYLSASMLLQHVAKAGWTLQCDFMWPEKVQKLYSPVINVFKFKGHWYSAGMMPGPKPFILFYRPSWLKKATGSSEPPKSYLEILEKGEQVAKWARKELGAGYYGLALPGKDHRYMWGVSLGPVHSQGGSYVDPETGRVEFLTEPVKNTWKWLVDIYKKGVAPKESLGWSWAESPEVFGRGKAGMVLAGSVNAVRYENPELSPGIQGDWAIAEPIGWDVGMPPFTGDPWIGMAGVNPFAPPNVQAAALLWGDFYRSYQAQWNEMVYEGNETAAVGVYDLPSAKKYGLHLEERKKWESVAVLESLPPGGDDIFKRWLEWLHNAIAEKVDTDTALENAQKDADKIQI